MIGSLLIASSCSGYKQIDNAVADKMQAPELKDVRLGGAVGKKMETFFQGRILSEFAKDSVMQEAEDAFKNKIDNVVKAPIDYWQAVESINWKSVFYRRWANTDTDLKPYARTKPCARIYRGPL